MQLLLCKVFDPQFVINCTGTIHGDVNEGNLLVAPMKDEVIEKLGEGMRGLRAFGYG